MSQIRYTITSSSFPVVVYLKDAEGNVIDSNTHYANEEGSFEADLGAYYILQFDPESEECGAILDVQTELIYCTTTTTTEPLTGLYVIIYYFERVWQNGILDGLRGYFTVDQPDDETVTLLIFPFSKVWNRGYYAGAGDYVIDGSDIQHWTHGSQDIPSFRYRVNGGAWVSGLPTTINVPSGVYVVEIEVSENSSFTTTTTTEVTTTTTTVCERPAPLDNYLIRDGIQFTGESYYVFSTLEEACGAWVRLRNGDPYDVMHGSDIEMESVTAGIPVYSPWDETDCCGYPEVFAWIYPYAIDDVRDNIGLYFAPELEYYLTTDCITILEIKGDICGGSCHIESINECCLPTTTTTTEVTTTTTTCLDCTTTTTTEGATTTTTTCLSCTTTTTTVAVYSFLVKYANTPEGVCIAPVLTVYSNVPDPGIGDIIYIDNALSTPWNIPYPYLLFSPYDDLEWIISYEVPPPLGIFEQGELMWQQPYNCTTTTTTSAPGGDYRIEIVEVVNYLSKAAVDESNLAAGTLYAFKIRLQNPDPGFSFNLLYEHVWTELIVSNRYEVTWLGSYYWDSAIGQPFYTIFDHDIDVGNPGFIKAQITDLPTTNVFDEGTVWAWVIPNNETGYVYLPFVIKPYANLSGKKTIFTDFSKYYSNSIIINPHWVLQVNFVQDTVFRMYSEYICIEGNNTFYAYGIKDSVKAELYVYGGAVPLYTWEYDLDFFFYVNLEEYIESLDTGYYIFKFYNNADVLLYTTDKIPIQECLPEGISNSTVLISIDRAEGGLQFISGLERVNRLYKLDPATNDTKKLRWPWGDRTPYLGEIITSSENRLYVFYDYIYHYTLTRSPFEIDPIGMIETPFTDEGYIFCMKDNNTIICASELIEDRSIYELDISHIVPIASPYAKQMYSGIIVTKLWELPDGIKFAGAIKMTTTNKLLFIGYPYPAYNGSKLKMYQADYSTGTIEFSIDLQYWDGEKTIWFYHGSSFDIKGMYFYDGHIWYTDSERHLYKIQTTYPYTITFIKTLDIPKWSGTITQSFDYMTEHFIVTTTTTTAIPTTTTTTVESTTTTTTEAVTTTTTTAP